MLLLMLGDLLWIPRAEPAFSGFGAVDSLVRNR
jgi:hypothetical protein